ncbi:hypothetical protein [Pseudomonas sp. TE3610]
MSELRQALLAQLSRLDEAAFVALANRGLYRRACKDLDSHPPSLREEAADELVLECDGHRVCFDARGVAFARCACPASGVCQHILTAALSLQQAPQDALPNVAVQQAHLSELRQALLDIPHAQLLKHAGKAGYRWAFEWVQGLERQQALQVTGQQHLVITLGQPPVTLRYLGGPLQGMLVEPAATARTRYQVAAVLAVQHAAGQGWVAPQPVARATEDAGASPHEASRHRLRQQARQLLEAAVGLGLAHLSAAMQQRFVTLAVWARGAHYPRLALSLQRLADQVQQLLERSAGADTQRLLHELSRCYGLLQALHSAAARGQAPAHLVGQVRSRYVPTASLELWGLGASAWRSASGYLGLTLLFWSPAQQGFLSASEVRPQLQGGVDPLLRYTLPGPWTGLGSPAQASGRRLSLQSAQVNAQGRLSLAESVVAVVHGELTAAQLQQLPAISDWQQLPHRHRACDHSLLASAQPMLDWVVLAPAGMDALHFDPARQVLVWPMRDLNGAWLNLELSYSPYTRQAIANLEAMAGQPWRPDTRWVARLQARGAGWVAEPLSTFCLADGAVVDVHFAPSSPQHPALVPIPAPQAERSVPDAPAGCPTLAAFALWLWQQAERGVQACPVLEQALQQWAARLHAAGYSAIERTAPGTGLSARLIIAHYLCLQYQHLARDADEAPHG